MLLIGYPVEQDVAVRRRLEPASIIRQVVLPDPDGAEHRQELALGMERFRSFTTSVSPS
jgi:hypothetical protein